MQSRADKVFGSRNGQSYKIRRNYIDVAFSIMFVILAKRAPHVPSQTAGMAIKNGNFLMCKPLLLLFTALG